MFSIIFTLVMGKAKDTEGALVEVIGVGVGTLVGLEVAVVGTAVIVAATVEEEGTVTGFALALATEEDGAVVGTTAVVVGFVGLDPNVKGPLELPLLARFFFCCSSSFCFC